MAELLAQMEAFFVQCLQFREVIVYATHLHWLLRADTNNLVFTLQILYQLQLFVISFDTMTKGNTQTRVVLIDKIRYLSVTSRLSLSIITSRNNNVCSVPRLHCAYNGDGIYYASIKHWHTINPRYFAEERQTA